MTTRTSQIHEHSTNRTETNNYLNPKQQLELQHMPVSLCAKGPLLLFLSGFKDCLIIKPLGIAV